MRILIVTPAPKHSLKGNRITAVRWEKLLRGLGHRVEIDEKYQNQECDLLIALHARRSATSIRRFRSIHATRPLIVALTGTDLYQDLENSVAAKKSLELADRLILLQPGWDPIPANASPTQSTSDLPVCRATRENSAATFRCV